MNEAASAVATGYFFAQHWCFLSSSFSFPQGLPYELIQFIVESKQALITYIHKHSLCISQCFNTRCSSTLWTLRWIDLWVSPLCLPLPPFQPPHSCTHNQHRQLTIHPLSHSGGSSDGRRGRRLLLSSKMEVSASSPCEKKAAVVPEETASGSVDAYKQTASLVRFSGSGCAVLAQQDMRQYF